MGRSTIGLDFGSRTLKAAVFDGGSVTRLLEEPVPEHLVRSGVITEPEAMGEFLRALLKERRIPARRGAVILPASQVFVQLCQLPVMTRAQLEWNLPYEFRDFISEDRENYFYDYAVIETAAGESGGETMRLLAAAASKKLIADYRELFRQAGLKLVTAIPVEMAYANLLRAAPAGSSSRETCIVDCGYTGHRVYFYSGGSFETAQIGDLGGAELDQMLSGLLGVDAPALYDREAKLREMPPQVRGLARETLRDVQRAVNFYLFSHPERRLEAGYYCGGGSRRYFLREELSNATGLPMRPITELLGSVPDREKALCCAAAIGAAIQ